MKQRATLMISLLLSALPVSAAELDRNDASNHLNALRVDSQLSELQYSMTLETAARRHAEDMVRKGFFSHTGSDGSGIGERLTRSGYGWCAAAENIASGQPTLADVMRAWTKSRGHRKNMLNTSVSEFALVRAPGNIWVMVLARPGC
ncbi:CAP domain-containing protein [Parasedimentitalea psychrophila]|uniref:CAP domain-containing protein n=1 Tax=Parasedimentitalea psychrophila TaxID=2997337 RepID=A0A9Y2KWI2_9RHOB|nr:CAP domain-containing protein [Parasedimentitalea psychrophila]WIY23968.1 CAP domain-containing protein [Parasedimentitalea psychrophila]